MGSASTLIGMAMVVFFFSAGQAVELLAVEKASPLALLVTLISYVSRVVLLWLGLQLVLDLASDRLSTTWIAIGLVSGTVGWLVGMLVITARQRTPVFDADYQPPAGCREEQ